MTECSCHCHEVAWPPHTELTCCTCWLVTGGDCVSFGHNSNFYENFINNTRIPEKKESK